MVQSSQGREAGVWVIAETDDLQTKFVKMLMRKSMLTSDDRILPEKQITERFLEAVMSFAYGLYVLLARRCGMDVEVNPWKRKDKPAKKN